MQLHAEKCIHDARDVRFSCAVQRSAVRYHTALVKMNGNLPQAQQQPLTGAGTLQAIVRAAVSSCTSTALRNCIIKNHCFEARRRPGETSLLLALRPGQTMQFQET